MVDRGALQNPRPGGRPSRRPDEWLDVDRGREGPATYCVASRDATRRGKREGEVTAPGVAGADDGSQAYKPLSRVFFSCKGQRIMCEEARRGEYYSNTVQ